MCNKNVLNNIKTEVGYVTLLSLYLNTVHDDLKHKNFRLAETHFKKLSIINSKQKK